MSNELSTTEQSELATYESVIEQGLQTFYEVGTALLAIRDKRLYRADYGTWEAYCQSRWEFTPQYAGMLMRGVNVLDNLKNVSYG